MFREFFTFELKFRFKSLSTSYVSARYQMRRVMYQGAANPIAIEVYHTAGHTYDVDDMIDSSKAGLAYFEKNFSPFQFRQYRILEYPRYRTFAQSCAAAPERSAASVRWSWCRTSRTSGIRRAGR